MAQNQNPFADFFKQPTEAWKSVSKQFPAQIPAFNVDEVTAAARRNWEVAAEASQTVAEGIQALAKRQWEIAQENAESAFALFKEVASSKDPKEGAAKQADYAKNALERSISGSKELIDIATKSNAKAYEIISSQVSESIKEFSGSASSGKPSASSSGAQRKAA